MAIYTRQITDSDGSQVGFSEARDAFLMPVPRLGDVLLGPLFRGQRQLAFALSVAEAIP